MLKGESTKNSLVGNYGWHTPFLERSGIPNLLRARFSNGSGGRDRTYDLVINSHPLCR